MFENNKLVKLLNIKYPIIQGGMAGVSDAVLVSAVSNAGGLGVIGSGFWSAKILEEEIKKTRELTQQPFGVNLLLQNTKAADLVKVCVEQKVAAVFTGGGNPLPVMPFLKQAGIKVFAVVPSARLAGKIADNGADGVVVEGLESGGHIGESTTFCLVPQARLVVKNIPLIAAGGIFDGRTLAAALMLGADGVQIGTLFMATKECQIHENYKQAIINTTDESTAVVGRFTGHPVRVIKNKLAEEFLKFEKKNPFPEELKSEKMAGGKVPLGNVDAAPLLCGIAAGGIKEIKTCKQVIEDLVGSAQEAIASANKILE